MKRRGRPTKADGNRPSGSQKAALPNANTGLQFVNLTDTAVLGASARKLVRSHVMKDYEKRSGIMLGSEPPRVAATPVENLQKGIRTWNAALTVDGLKSRSRDNEVKLTLRQASPASSSTSPASTSSEHSLKSYDFESNVDGNGGWGMIDYTNVQLSNQPVTWDPGDAEFSGISSLSRTEDCIANGRQNWKLDELDDLSFQNISIYGVSNERVDPFETLPFSTPRSEVLLAHFFSRITVASLVMSARKHWFILGMGDRAFFLVALSHAAAHIARLHRKSAYASEALQLRTEAIKVINDRILNVDACGPHDGTIGAVASILSYEATNGSDFAIRTHMTGLAQMIFLRGGIISAGFSGVLLRLILRADLSTANILGTQPLYSFESDPALCDLSDNLCTTTVNQDMIFPARNGSPFTVLPPELSTALFELRDLVSILDVSEFAGATLISYNTDTLWFSDRIYIVQRRLMELTAEYVSLVSLPQQEHLPSMNQSIAATAAIACLLFIECFLRDTSPRSRIIGILVSRLVLAIEHVHDAETGLRASMMLSLSPADEYTRSDGMVCILAWVFAVGRVAATVEGDLPGQIGWWMQGLNSMTQVMVDRGNRDLGAALKSVVWPEGVFASMT